MANDDWEPGTIFLRHWSRGASHVEAHRCWATKRFIEEQREACRVVNAKDPEARARIEVVDAKAYDADRFQKKRKAR
jgi:hypothetical protein